MENFGYFYLVFGLGVFAIELISGRHRGIYTRDDHMVNGLCGVIGTAVTRPLTAVLTALSLAALLPGARSSLSEMPVWLGYLLTLLAGDFSNYWAHRWAHMGRNRRGLGWLWKLHRTHHSGKFMNTLLVYRINPFWTIIQPVGWVVGTAAFLGQEQAAVLAGLTFYVWNVITHSHFRWDDAVRRHRLFGPVFRALEHVIVSPGVHHTHHGYGKDGASYRNFAILLSLFDTLFGTLHIPDGRPHRYGLPGPNPRWTEEVFYPLVSSRPAAKTSEVVSPH